MMSNASLLCVMLLLIAGISAQGLKVEVVTIQNCTCDDCPAKHPVSGKCSVDPLNPTTNGRIITCMDQVQQCAQLINFNDAACTAISGVFTAVCGTCQKLNAVPPYYARANCDPITNAVTWDTNCNVGCGNCINKGSFVHPFSTCSPGLGGNGYTYNQGVMSCDAVNVTVVQSPTCAAGVTVLDQFVVGQFSCNFGEFMSCSPKNPAITPPTGTAIVMSQCPWGTGTNIEVCASCPQTYFPSNSCQPPPPNVYDQSVKSIRATCESKPAMCGDLVIHGNTQCSMFVGRSTPVCGGCMMLGATDGPPGTYSNISCNLTSQSVTISHGCTPDCSSCSMPNYITHGFLQCSIGDPNGTSTYNRGLFPCNVIAYNHYTDTNCQNLYHVEHEADAVCQFDRMSQCVDRVVTFQNCTNPASTVTTMENACVADPVVDGNFRVYNCKNQAPVCSEVVEYSDPGCTVFVDAASMVCDQCMKIFDRTNPTVPMYQSITCNTTDQSVTIKTNCDSTCTNCLNPNVITHHVGACSVSPSGHFVRNEGLNPCDAVNVEVFTTNNCSASSLIGNFTISQDVCTFHEFVQCSADPLPIPPMGNELVYEMCLDPHCGYGCAEVVDTMTGGCIPNYQGRPGAHVVSCDATESWCADLSIHSGQSCGPFIGNFHPVCGSCSPWYNETDPNGFYLVTCDSANPNVTVSGGCDSQCQNCKYPNLYGHPYLQCSQDMLSHDRSIINRGVVPCATVSIIEYSDISCRGSTQVASWQQARDFCDMGHHTTCSPATIGIQNCSACNGNSNNAACNKTLVSEGACVPDPYSTILGGTRTVSCVPQWQQCVHLAMFTDGNCATATYRASTQAVCNQCNQLIEVDAQGNRNIVFAKLTCNAAYNWISIQTHCNSDCSSCNETDTTLLFDQCTPTNFLGGVFNFGMENCDAVQISQYHDAKCASAPVSTYMIGQHQCAFDEYYECSARPMMETIPFNGKVVKRTCDVPGDVACTNCTTEQFASASCQFNPFKFGAKNHFGTYTITCSSFDFEATCANFAIHTDSQCSQFAGDHHPVCGACVQLPGETNFTQVMCDTNTQDVTFNKDCDPKCNTCGSTITHKFMTCDQITNASPQMNGKFIYNRGLMPCDTVLVQQFNSMNCAPASLAAAWPQATSACEFGGAVQCVPHIVHIEQCANPTAAATVVAEGACTPDAYGKFRQYRCFDESLTCATLIMYNTSSQCTPNVNQNGETRPLIIAGVCGSCQKRPSKADPNIIEYFLMNCDQNKQTVTFDGGCNANCQRCTQPRMETHPFMQCSNGYMPGSSVFNQGIRPCSGVQVSVFPDNTCTGSSQAWMEAGQRDCGEFDHLYIYCDANPNIIAPDGGQVLMTMCPWQQGEGAIKRVVEGDCTSGCNTFPIVDGACAPAPPFETRFASHRLSCDTQRVGMCADIILFNSSTTCTPATFMGIHAPVCDSCYLFGNDITYTKVLCNIGRQEVSFMTGCNADCSQCTTNTTIETLQCDPTVRPGFSMVSRGLFQCPTVTFTHYSSTDCLPGTSIGTFIAAQGVCEFNQRLQCSKNLVTIQNCSCPTCAATYTADSQCAPDAFGGYRKYECANTAVQCVNMGFFANDDQCSQYSGGYSVVCDTCMKQTDPFTGEAVYVGIICNVTSQQVTSITGCSDSSCSDCNGGTFTHPFNQCSRFMRGSSVFNSGMQPCATIDVTVYSDSLCSTQSVDHWEQGQDFCVMDQYISCSAAPVVNQPSVVPNNALEFYTCPVGTGLDYGCIGCTVSTEMAGSCYPSDVAGHYRSTTCDSHMAFCASFVMHNDTTCVGAYLGDHNPVCGSCTRWFNGPDYTLIHCDVFSHNVTVSFGCNSDCSVCANNVTHGFMQCQSSHPGWTMYNRGVQPCSTVSLTEYSASDCNAGSVIATYPVAQDLCQYGHKVKCFYEGSPLIPTAAAPASGLSAGAAAGITILVVAIAGAAGFAVFKYRQRKVYRSVDPQWSAMNESPSPSHVQGSYGSLQGADPTA